MKKIIAVLSAVTILFSIAIPASSISMPSAPKLSSVKNKAGGILIRWSSVKNADKYVVYRKTAGVKFSRLVSTKKTTCTHKGAVSGKKYTYKVFAVNSKGKSLPSKQKSLTRVGTPSLKMSNTKFAIKARWSKVKNATAYALLCKKSSAKKYELLYRGKKQSYIHDNIASGIKYDFKVKALIGKLRGAYSSVKSQMFLERPSLHAEELIDMKGITLTWNSVKNAEGYIIYRSLKSKNSYKRILKTTKALTKYVDGDLESINSYKYYIRAYNGSFKSVKSNVSSDVYGYLNNFSTPLNLTVKKGEVYKDIYNKIDHYGATPFITWKSLKPSVASVTVDGIITGKKKGTAKLKATVDPELFKFYGKSEYTEAKVITIIVTVK